MISLDRPTTWQRWLSHPQNVWLRKAIFQLHMWSGIGIGLYVLVISITGSIVVYRNELYEKAKSPFAISAVSALLQLHSDLFAGSTGRMVNGLGGVLVIVLALTGLVVWWPGIKTWRRSLIIHKNVGWRRFAWELHSMIGFWGLGVTLLFGLSGAYLGFPDVFQGFADWLAPPPADYNGNRLIDQAIYWLAYLHFGRIQGIGIPCKGPGLCDQATKLTWAVAGLVPAVMFGTGAVMWWNRVVRKRLRPRADAKVLSRSQ